MAMVPATTDPDLLAELIDRDGFVIVERVAPEQATAAHAELIDDVTASPFGHTEFLGDRTQRVGSILRRSPAARELAVHPIVLALADRVLGPHCARYQLNFSGVMHLSPGAIPQPIHRDGDLYPFRHPCPPTIMPTMWALSDFTTDNGATLVVPGSHRWDEDRDPFPDEIVAAEMPLGSVLIYVSGTLHGAGANVSSSTRTGMSMQYSLAWLRQEENQYLANPPDVARTYPLELQRLIGYDLGGPYLGFAHGRSPMALLADDDTGPQDRSTPELDARAALTSRHQWGNLTAVPTPIRIGTPVGATRGVIVDGERVDRSSGIT